MDGQGGKGELETRVDGWTDGWMDGHGKDHKGRMGLQRRSRWALEVLRVVCMTWLTFINDLTDDLDGRAVGYPMNLSLLLRLGLFLVTQVGEATEATRWPRGRDRMGLKMDLGVHRSSRRSGKEAFAYLVWIFMSSLYLCERTLNKIDKIGPFRSVCLWIVLSCKETNDTNALLFKYLCYWVDLGASHVSG